MKQTKVLNIIQRYHPAKGGAELFIKVLSEYQSKNLGYDVDVWTTNAYTPDALWDLNDEIVEQEKEDIEGVHVRRFAVGEGIFRNKYINKVVRVLFDRFPNFKIANLASCPTAYGMLKAIDETDFSEYAYVTVSSTPYYFLFYVGYLISKKYNIPYIIAPAFHTGEHKHDSLRRKYFKKTAVPFFEYACKILVNTKAEQIAIMKFCQDNGVMLKEEKFVVLGQGIYLEKINGGDGKRFREKYNLNDPIVFQMGSKNYEKGSMNLVESMKLVWDSGIKCHLVFGGQYSEDFSKYLDGIEGKYRENILNIDNISDEEKFDLFDACNIFSMISKTDSFGIVYLEAWAYGKPVLACNNEALSEIISNDVDGYLLKFDDIRVIANTIENLLNDEEVAKHMGMEGRKKVEEKYDWSKGIKLLDSTYEKRS
ncbi:glycosyltransferase family 4 protein [Patescibacteria group bacterium]|nr:glycosyltransferase family 4 protein [Patescibacteria group bacterium]